MYKYVLGDYDIGHRDEGEAQTKEEMVSAARAFAEKYCSGADDPIVIDEENKWLVIGYAADDFDPEMVDGNVLEDGRYIIGCYEVVD